MSQRTEGPRTRRWVVDDNGISQLVSRECFYERDQAHILATGASSPEAFYEFLNSPNAAADLAARLNADDIIRALLVEVTELADLANCVPAALAECVHRTLGAISE